MWKENKIDFIITGISIAVIFFMYLFKSVNYTVLGCLLLIINGYLVWKYRKSKFLFFFFLVLFYFNYSYAISKYIGPPSNMLNELFVQLVRPNTMTYGIVQQILFLLIVNLCLGNKQTSYNLSFSNEAFKGNTRKWIVIGLQWLLGVILILHIVLNITENTTIFEYSLYIFMILFYLSKNHPKEKILSEIIMVMFAIYSLKNGDRIAVLQFFLADFLINYLDKFSLKVIMGLLCCGIFAFTLLGLYGDFLDTGKDFKDLTLTYTVNEMIERRFALDTSVSSYYCGLSMIDVCPNYPINERISEGITYLTHYTLLGSAANFVTPPIKIREYERNTGGGYLTSYFYYWFGWIGVIAISLYVGLFLRFLLYHKRPGMLNNLLLILFVTTMCRWYLYVPNFLIRGVLLFIVFYFIVYIGKCILESQRSEC